MPATAAALWMLGAGACGTTNPNTDEQKASYDKLQPTAVQELDPNAIPKFVNQVVKPNIRIPTLVRDSQGRVIRHDYTNNIAKFTQQVLPPGFPPTPLFGYAGAVRTPEGATVFERSSPGPTYEETRGIPAQITYQNDLLGPHPLPVDPTLDWANPNGFPKPSPPFVPFPPGYPQAQEPIPHVTHIHGIEVDPRFDGTPDTWFTNDGRVGPEFVSRTYQIPNSNLGSQFWYHDHVFGMTRLNVHSGLVGFYTERDPADPLEFPPAGTQRVLPPLEFEIPLVIQDKTFNSDGTVFYPRVGDNPDINPYWVLQFDGKENVVNGKVWPNLNVQRRQYRFRILNASNQRFYRFRFSNGMSFTMIGSDGGFLERGVNLTSIRMGVTERIDILVDFSQFAPGTKIVLQNTEQLSPPIGPPVDPNTDGTVMQFTVVDSPVVTPPPLPARLNTIATLVPDRPRRTLILNADVDAAGRILQAQLDGQLFHNPASELPTVGATEEWDFLNTTPLDHTKHVHLIQFRLVGRQNFDAPRYLADWLAANGDPPLDRPTIKLPIEPYLTGPFIPAPPEESGWKDSIQAPAGQITRIVIRFAPPVPNVTVRPGVNAFPINPVDSIGFIWHCHLVEHEDNEMMRPMNVVDIWRTGISYRVGDIVDFNGIDYQVRQSHVSQSDWTPPQVFALFERVNNQNGDWAPQIIFRVGHRTRFNGHIYRAIQQHQAIPGWEPDRTPALWQLVL
jgi:FtsP/CotA-like multicopper oxidase with cupredoxin domain